MTDTQKDSRDLSFVPVRNAAPKRLTAEQIETYNREGFVKPLTAFTGKAVEANRAYFDRLLGMLDGGPGGVGARFGGAYAINCYQARCRGIYDLCMNPTILDHVEDIVGPNVICWASHFFCKLPHDTRAVPWHQDASYWHLSPSRTVTVWLAIDDSDEENSAMKFIPGTHAMGHLSWKKAEGPVVLDQEIEGAESLGEPVHDVLAAGQFSLHADMLAHGSDPNASDRRRCGLTIRYCPPEVRRTSDKWLTESIICRGEDPDGYWEHHPRPAGEDLSRIDGPKNVGGN